MFFLLSGAVRFHAKPVLECAVRSTPRLGSKAKVLAQELHRLEAKDIKKQLHVNEALAKQYVKHLQDFEKQQPVSACCLYDTPLFNNLNAPDFDEDDAEWANSYVRIFSGLYGLLRPFDEIQPLSLPVSMATKLTTTKGKFLRDFWRDPVQQELQDGLLKLPMPVIVTLAAEEDNELLDKEVLPQGTRIARVNFKTIDREDGPAAIGEFVRWALQNRCMTVEDLLDFKGLDDQEQGATYRVNPKASEPDKIVFEENIGDGGTGGWSKKLAEFGGSKKKFVKEFASGKDRYKRTELNKALIKEDKKKRTKSAVY
mmetsp:Transcript_70623/g.218367  ORF Transcript_70623/g.218367 Transcript_70623/m.218367 type:complete len:313 (+) Transcript_70623:116-1054(+)